MQGGGLPDTIDEVYEGIDYRKRKKHGNKPDHRELEGCFRFFHFLPVSKSGNVEDGSKNDSSDRKDGSRKDELIGDTDHLCLYSGFDLIIARCYGPLWSTTFEGSLNTSVSIV